MISEMQDVERGIFQLHNGLSQASRDVDRLGTKADTQDLRDRLKNRLHDLKAKAMRLGTQVRDLHGEQKSEKTAKLTKNLQDALKQLSVVLDNAESKQAASLPRHTMPSQQAAPEAQEQAGDDVEQQALLQQQKQQSDAVFVGQMEHQEALIQEQHEGIEEIHRDLQEEMATLVNDQGYMIDDIEANVTRTAARVQEGTQQLVKADKSQRSVRQKKYLVGVSQLAPFKLSVH
eukprot:jgi/Astpho2/4657/Aster-x1226